MGISLVPAFTEQPMPSRIIFREHEINRAVRMGNWKLVAAGKLINGGYDHWKNYQTSE